MNVVAHNLFAMNSNRMLGINSKNKAKSAEKLSSGYKINKSADDAAGLSISEKMRRQIRGLTQGVDNTQDGVSLCQVADGALAEVTDMLHRITELSVKAANDTNTEEDRQAIQKEINQILREIERIDNGTEFNETKVFKGSNDISNSLGSGIGGGNSITIDRNYSLSGTPIDKTISQYNVSADKTNGVSVNGTNYTWHQLTNENGNTLADTPIQKGTYSLNYNGVDLSFDIKDIDSLDSICNALNGLSVNVDYTPPKTNGINSVSFKLYTPIESSNISKDEFKSFICKNEHKVIADSNGVKIDENGTVKTWTTIFSEAGLTEDDALKNGGTINIGETGKYDLNISFNSGMTIDDIVNEINGMTFKANGAIDDTTIINAYNPCNTTITANCTNFSLSSAFTQALGYDVLYGDNVMKAVYNDSAKTSTYPNALSLEFVPNTDAVSGVKNAYLVATKESVDKLAQIFSTGQTTTAGSVTINFVSPSYPITPTYGTSNVSIQWNYPAGINEADLWNSVGSGTPSPLFGADALELNIKTTYSASGLQLNNINTPEKISFSLDNSKVNNDIIIPSSKPNDKTSSLQLWIQSGCEVGDGMWLEIDSMNTSILGIDDVDVSTVDGANHAMDAVKGALKNVSANRAKIGAQQNRLEHTIANEENIIENTTSAESRIRDADMADEMVKFSNINILEQVSQSMLAQANQSQQGVLNLLR